MKLKNFEYQTDFDDFSSGVDISDERINSWIDIVVNTMKTKLIENPLLKQTHWDYASGNTFVIGTMYRQDNGKFLIMIRVTKSYMEYSQCDVDL